LTRLRARFLVVFWNDKQIDHSPTVVGKWRGADNDIIVFMRGLIGRQLIAGIDEIPISAAINSQGQLRHLTDTSRRSEAASRTGT
jgi:hypothetical protein